MEAEEVKIQSNYQEVVHDHEWTHLPVGCVLRVTRYELSDVSVGALSHDRDLNASEKAKPTVRWGRKATGLRIRSPGCLET